jgi:hypothetical protein
MQKINKKKKKQQQQQNKKKKKKKKETATVFQSDSPESSGLAFLYSSGHLALALVLFSIFI